MAFPWNAEGVEARLAKLWTEDGLTTAKIAVELSEMTGEPLTRNAVIGRINRLGLVKKGREQEAGPAGVAAADAPPAEPPVAEPVEVLAEPVIPVSVPEPAPLQASPVQASPQPLSPGVLLTDLRLGQCRFPITAHHAPSHLFCAAVVEAPGATYCSEHAAVCFDGRTPQERRRDQERGARARAGKEAA
ncbi:GcrA family cell cycle regulator [Methylobacterium fujisawaense]|uniref:GcrA family cell cycle regulator n=1 Tax=Methylobacterium fujisawaense TaxID=107400 RepID=UPI002F35CCBD